MKKTLIVVDMQRDFINGALGTPEAVAIIPAVIQKIKEYRDAGDNVIFTRDTHTPDYLNTMEGKNLPVVHCVMGTEGWGIPEEIDQVDCIHINKSSFGYLDWDTVEQWVCDMKEIELIGLCTDICVVSNALILKAMFPESVISVDPKCCAGVTPESHNAAITTMKMCQIQIKE